MSYILPHDQYWRKMDYILFSSKLELIPMNYVQRLPFCTDIQRKYNKDVTIIEQILLRDKPIEMEYLMICGNEY